MKCKATYKQPVPKRVAKTHNSKIIQKRPPADKRTWHYTRTSVTKMLGTNTAEKLEDF